MFNNPNLLDAALFTLKRILGSPNEDGAFNYIYPATTENIAGYAKYINNFSTVLTVAGSGDHAFNCIYHGAREITVFDINPITYYLIDLKKAMFTQSYSTFINFFTTVHEDWEKPSPLFFAESTYLSVRDLLRKDAQQFWDTYYQWLRDNNTTPQNSELFRHIRYYRSVILESAEYCATYEAYKKTADNMTFAKIEFIYSSIVDLPKMLGDGTKFNTILLSNLSDYVIGAFNISDGEEALDKYNSFVNNIMNNHLTLGGQIFFAYIYEASTGPGWTAIDNIANLPRHFDNYQLKALPAISRHRYKNWSLIDCVLIKEKTI